MAIIKVIIPQYGKDLPISTVKALGIDTRGVVWELIRSYEGDRGIKHYAWVEQGTDIDDVESFDI